MKQTGSDSGQQVQDDGAAPAKPKSAAATPFSLSKWFAIVGLISIAMLSVVAAALLTRFLTEHMLRQEAVLTMEFVQSVVMTERSFHALGEGSDADRRQLEEVFRHIARMPDVLRTNIYAPDRTLIWSSDASLIGMRFSDNDELEASLRGELTVQDEDSADPTILAKAEHQNLDKSVNYFVEIYLPVWGEHSRQVAGVVELYKNPRALFEAIQVGRIWIWTSAVIGGFFLYFALFSMIRRADEVIKTQQDRLVENETLAVVGEMGTAVAHGIRNPLTAIRSSAELAMEGEPDLSREAARDIIAQVDRLEQWVRDLLSYSRPVGGKLESIALAPLLQESLGNFARDMERRQIKGAAQIEPDLPWIKADSMLLAQVVNSLIANALEAMQKDGSLVVGGTYLPPQKQVVVSVSDTGPGMSREQVARVFKPFYTTKPKGLGVGLPLARRIVERFGGKIEIRSVPGKGTTVNLTFPAVS